MWVWYCSIELYETVKQSTQANEDGMFIFNYIDSMSSNYKFYHKFIMTVESNFFFKC